MLNWADLVLLGIVAVSTLVGLWRGFIVEALGLLVWVGAFFAAFQFGKPVSDLFAGSIDTPSARLFAAYALLFVGVLMLGGLVTWLVGRMVSSTGLSGTDRTLGLVFGLLRGGAVACLLVLLLGFTPMPQDDWWRESRLMPGFERGAVALRELLPEAAAQHVNFEAAPLALPLLQPPAPDQAPPGD